MVSLVDDDKNRVRYHLNYVPDVVDAGVQAWLEKAMDTIRSNYHEQRIIVLLDRCEAAEDEAATPGEDSSNSSFGLAAKETYAGDITRTRIQYREINLNRVS